MTDNANIREHMDVVCSCGTSLGKVDHLDGDRIKLTRSDPSAGGKHHWVPMDWVEKVDGSRVLLNKNSEEEMADWEEEGEDAGATADRGQAGRMTQQQQGDRAAPAKSQPAGTRAAQGMPQDGKTAPQDEAGAPAKAGAARSRAGADQQQDSDTQPRK